MGPKQKMATQRLDVKLTKLIDDNPKRAHTHTTHSHTQHTGRPADKPVAKVVEEERPEVAAANGLELRAFACQVEVSMLAAVCGPIVSLFTCCI